MSTTTIWDNFKDQLLLFIRARINDPVLTEDLLQEVFIKVHLNQHKLKEVNNITSWLYTITRNVIIDAYRRRKNEFPLDMKLEVLEEADMPLDTPADFNRCLQPFLDDLPEKYKTALLATTFEGISQKELAQREQLSYSNVKSRVQRAREMVKQKLIDCCHPVADVYGNIVSKDEECKTNCGCT